MEKFILRGYNSSRPGAYSEIKVPKAKTFETVAVKKGEEKIYSAELIMTAVKRRKTFNHFRDFETCHIEPFAQIDNKSTKLSKTLQQLLTPHPFPLSQGPLILPLDLETNTNASVDHVVSAKTVFSHSPSQPCGLWDPAMSGLAAWTTNIVENTFSFHDDNLLSIAGVSSLMDMSVVYTCQLHSCVIKCPCNVCRATPGDCCNSRQSRLNCKTCNPQCSAHQITDPYTFNPSHDLYTIVTESMTKYRHAYGYAGIPKSCEQCVTDLSDHQVLHLVSHDMCRFCRFET